MLKNRKQKSLHYLIFQTELCNVLELLVTDIDCNHAILMQKPECNHM